MKEEAWFTNRLLIYKLGKEFVLLQQQKSNKLCNVARLVKEDSARRVGRFLLLVIQFLHQVNSYY